MWPPWATITPRVPAATTSTSAVTECDLFFVLIAVFSESRRIRGRGAGVWTLHHQRATRDVRVDALGFPVVERKDVVLGRLEVEQALQLGDLFGHLLREIVGLRPILGRVVELPDVVAQWRLRTHHHPRQVAVPGDGRPALVIDAAVADHLEVLRLVPLGGLRCRRTSTAC
jgi:hypothetical protein